MHKGSLFAGEWQNYKYKSERKTPKKTQISE